MKDNQELFEYAALRLRESRRRVDDLTWGLPKSQRLTDLEEQAYRNYLQAIEDVASQESMEYREVMTFPDLSRIKRAETILHKKLYGYQLRYYDVDDRKLPPLLEFFLIDGEEVVLSFYRGEKLSKEEELHISIRHPEIVSLFQDYYDAIWQGATVIKDAGLSFDSVLLAQKAKALENTNSKK